MSGPILNLLFFGDVVGKGGRRAVAGITPQLRQKYNCQFVIANAENSACGAGLTQSSLKEMPGIDVYTAGDHVWDRKEFEQEINGIKNVIRPANLSKKQPGKGWDYFRNPAGGDVAVISLMGKVFMKDSAYCPFETVEEILKQIPITVKCIIVDFHAEATSEKLAMAHFLDGKVTAVFGTHTHVQTADARVSANGTASITDVGMVGGNNSILGRSCEDVLRKFRIGMPCKLAVVEEDIRCDAVVLSYEMNTGRAVSLTPLSIMFDPDKEI